MTLRLLMCICILQGRCLRKKSEWPFRDAEDVTVGLLPTPHFLYGLGGYPKSYCIISPPVPPREFMMETERENLSHLGQFQRQKLEHLTLQIGQLLREFNQWGCEVGQTFPRLIPFICLATDLGDAEDMVKELVIGVEHGAKGVQTSSQVILFLACRRRLWPVTKSRGARIACPS